jgi:endonuclease/exonuclease/phosphatase family metal-dependent hydrolase
MADHRAVLTLKAKDRKRVIDRLLSLKSLLGEKTSKAKKVAGDLGIPAKTVNKSLLVATWNLREFGAGVKAGQRIPESLHYIAEIISAFDLVALQEVNENHADIRRIMKILGEHWDFLVTDVTLGPSGNHERSAFVYDRRKVHFEGFAGQVVLPPTMKIDKKPVKLEAQFARTPFVAGFRAGDFRFTVCTVHIYYGKATANDERRVKEIEAIAQYLASRANSDHGWAPTSIVIGDFNIFRHTDRTAAGLVEAGFYLPPQLAALPAGETQMNYDQIAILAPKYDESTKTNAKRARAGVVDFYAKVFRDDDKDWKVYAPMFPKGKGGASEQTRRKYFREWRTFQMSDHRPRWIELKADFGRERLAKWKHMLARGESVEG